MPGGCTPLPSHPGRQAARSPGLAEEIQLRSFVLPSLRFRSSGGLVFQHCPACGVGAVLGEQPYKLGLSHRWCVDLVFPLPELEFTFLKIHEIKKLRNGGLSGISIINHFAVE